MRLYRRHFKIPTFGWVAVGFILVIAVLLVLPSSRQKQFNEAKHRLDLAAAAAEKLEKSYRGGEFAVFELPYVDIGASKVVIWNPDSKSDIADHNFEMPSLQFLSSGKALAPDYGHFVTYGIIFAPDPKAVEYTDYAVLALAWQKDKRKWPWLDALRKQLRDRALRKSAAAKVAKHLAGCNPGLVAEARSHIARNVRLCTGIGEANGFFNRRGELFLTKSDNYYLLYEDYRLVHNEAR